MITISLHGFGLLFIKRHKATVLFIKSGAYINHINININMPENHDTLKREKNSHIK